MKSHVILTVLVLLAALASPAGATLITVGAANDVAMSGTVTSSPEIGALNLPQFSPANLIDGKVSNLMDFANDGEGTSDIFMDGAGPHTVTVTWAQPRNLSSLQTYVVSNTGANTGGTITWDRTVSAVTFSVDQGAGLTPVGTVNTANTNEVSAFDLTKLDGNWSNVIAVQYTFTPADATGSNGPRVAEVLAISTIPEPSSMVIMSAGLLSLLAYAWRKQR